MAKVYLSLGSNVGNRKRYIKCAIEKIEDFCVISQTSSFYETEPWGKTDQPPFLNLCTEIDANLKPQNLLNKLKQIEITLGRQQTTKWAKREIDIDILFYDTLVIDEAGLNIPHKQIEQRAFVLVPMQEIASNYLHPTLHKTINELANSIDATGVRKITDD